MFKTLHDTTYKFSTEKGMYINRKKLPFLFIIKGSITADILLLEWEITLVPKVYKKRWLENFG